MGEPVDRFEQLRAHETAFDAATTASHALKAWPRRYALTDQVRRASRSVCANIAEAWAKRPFAGKLGGAHGEAAETIVKMIRHREKWCGPASGRQDPAPYVAGVILDFGETDDR